MTAATIIILFLALAILTAWPLRRWIGRNAEAQHRARLNHTIASVLGNAAGSE